MYSCSELKNLEHHYIQVDSIHRIHVMQAGNRSGFPLLFIHGGPGSGVNTEFIDYIDNELFNIIMIDQRGAGLSEPPGEIKNNTLQLLIDDIEIVRTTFNIDQWLITGGSWGSLLAIAYALKHRTRVIGLILRGIFLGSEQEINWLYSADGAAKFYPDVWKTFIEGVDSSTIKDRIFSTYSSNLHSSNLETRQIAAYKWLSWASVSMGAAFELKPYCHLTNKDIAKAKIMCHFLSNKCFIKGDDNLLKNIAQLADIPLWLVNGRQDIICPPSMAFNIANTHGNTQLILVDGVGHSPADPDVKQVLQNFLGSAAKCVVNNNHVLR